MGGAVRIGATAFSCSVGGGDGGLFGGGSGGGDDGRLDKCRRERSVATRHRRGVDGGGGGDGGAPGSDGGVVG